MNSFSKLIAAKEALSQINSEWSQWLLDGINGSLHNGQSLDDALRIKGARYRYLKQNRDRYLVEAWQLLPEKLTDWKRSSQLADLIFKFETCKWLRLQHHGQPPDKLDDIERLLFKAFQLGMRMPLSSRQVQNIILQNLKGVHNS